LLEHTLLIYGDSPSHVGELVILLRAILFPITVKSSDFYPHVTVNDERTSFL